MWRRQQEDLRMIRCQNQHSSPCNLQELRAWNVKLLLRSRIMEDLFLANVMNK